MQQLWKLKLLDDGELVLTEAGGKHIRRLMTLHPDGLGEAGPFKVVVGPIASGAPVVEDPTIFDRLSDSMRKVVGLEMETSAILALAYLRKLDFAVVMKGVMDHADAFKSDNMKPFAARARFAARWCRRGGRCGPAGGALPGAGVGAFARVRSWVLPTQSRRSRNLDVTWEGEARP